MDGSCRLDQGFKEEIPSKVLEQKLEERHALDSRPSIHFSRSSAALTHRSTERLAKQTRPMSGE